MTNNHLKEVRNIVEKSPDANTIFGCKVALLCNTPQRVYSLLHSVKAQSSLPGHYTTHCKPSLVAFFS